jgi:phosphoserine phosphatase RsbU/P
MMVMNKSAIETNTSDAGAVAQNAELLKIELELQVARRIQAGFLPATLPKPEGWAIAAQFQPAREVAGDFYDAFMLSNNRRVGFVIADVVDKGVPAALFMALVRSLIRAFAQQNYSLSWMEAIEQDQSTKPKSNGQRAARPIPSTGTIALKNAVQLTNSYILENHLDLNMFATLFFGMFDPRTGHVAYINAGHNPPFIVGMDGTLKAKLKATGPAVGMFPVEDYQIDYAMLEPGDLLFAYTDGVTEARAANGEFFGEKQLLAMLAKSSQSAAAAIGAIEEGVNTFMSDAVQFDDITMIAIHRSCNNQSFTEQIDP